MQRKLKNEPSNPKYVLAFTAGAILRAESIAILSEYSKIKSWSETREKVIQDNIMGSKTQNTSKRLFREIESRLSYLNDEDVERIIKMQSVEKQKQILWLCICNRYQFIADFMCEVVSDKIAVLDRHLSYNDYNRFFNMKSQWHEELDAISESTQKKIKQVLFKMLKEINLLNSRNEINTLGNCYDEVKHLASKYSFSLNSLLPFYPNIGRY